MNGLLTSFSFFLFSFALTFLLRNGTQKRFAACGGVVIGSVIGMIPALSVLGGGDAFEATLGSFLPGMAITVGVDPLSAFFLVGIFVLSGLVGIYGFGYLSCQPKLLSSLPFFPLLVAAMAAVVCARDGFFFLMVWEVMSLASFFLVATEHEMREVREAGWIYLFATHLATVFLVIFFVFLFKETGSFSFEAFTKLHTLSPHLTGTLFLLVLAGFGTKAGIFPLHVWLPHAHPAAPSYISALMSGVMIKTGIYGILRTLTFLKMPPLWFGELLIGLGILSAVLGVLYALMQHDLKRFLAYHSVENIGIIIIGIGIGLIGITEHQAAFSILGFGGAFFHVWNHAIFKGLLFLWGLGMFF